MTDIAVMPEFANSSPPAFSAEYPSVKPRWLGPAATVGVVFAHIAVAVLLMATAIEDTPRLNQSDLLSICKETVRS